MDLQIERTADGSVTLYRPDMDEHYHSVKGAIAESRHVYLHLGWEYVAHRSEPVRVFEVGFGTGLNAALTAQIALDRKIETIYYSIELHPLSAEVINNIAYMQSSDDMEIFRQVNEAPWDKPVIINPYFKLCKMTGDLRETSLPADLNAAYFDAFAPEKQPDLWEENIFRKIYDSLAPGGVLTTYCAKGTVRRRLQSVGFTTERLPGPPAGKREVLRAIKY